MIILRKYSTNYYTFQLYIGLSEEPVVQREKEAVGSGGGSTWEVAVVEERRKRQQIRRRRMKMKGNLDHGENEDGEEEDEDNNSGGGGGERQREHPFIVTEPGEVARGKKNGLDYLFHLYEQCREFLIQVQAIAKERGEKCPTKVTNNNINNYYTFEFFRYTFYFDINQQVYSLRWIMLIFYQHYPPYLCSCIYQNKMYTVVLILLLFLYFPVISIYLLCSESDSDLNPVRFLCCAV
jgi:hypothetical protein